MDSNKLFDISKVFIYMIGSHFYWFVFLIILACIIYTLPKIIIAFNKPLATQSLNFSSQINGNRNIAPIINGNNNNTYFIEGAISMTEQNPSFNINGNNSQVNYNSPGSVQNNINQQRKILNKARVEKDKRSNDFITRLILTQTTGMWDTGIKFGLQVNMSGSYKDARIIQGLPGALCDVLESINKEAGLYMFSTSSAPLPNQPIILEIISEKDIDITNLGITPI